MQYGKLMSCVLTGLICGWSGLVNAEEPAKAEPKVEVIELQVSPASLELKGAIDSRRVLVSGTTADGRIVDVTPDVQLTLTGEAATLDDDRFVTPKAKGDAVLNVIYGGKTAAVAIKVTDATQAP